MNKEINMKEAGIKFKQLRNHWGLPQEAINLRGETGRSELVQAIEAGDPIYYPAPSGFSGTAEGSVVMDYWRFAKEKSITDCRILDGIRADIAGLEAHTERVDAQGEPESLEYLQCAADFYEEGVEIASGLMVVLGF
ncbi:hypothetical protein DSLASN_34860 [Desulfoluna limicola]|uniref:DUF1877 family protein n=1 Tax=Desulfoluna limicola TaxID=2810562 RepID=A0ABM7PKB8_9BACT|nr:hypothetical protein [Desulfoluna limicola]BCS97854.1 hypothetical protein DSLASN_34860 [Desulfoluna limicola]